MQNRGGLAGLLFQESSVRHDEDAESYHEDQHRQQYTRLASGENSDAEDEDPETISSEKQTVPTWKSVFNLMIYVAGGGYLAIPYFVKLGGITALLSLVLVPCVFWYTGGILIDCLYTRDSLHGDKIRVRSTYREIGQASLPHVGGILLDVYIYIGLFTSIITYFILCGQLLFSIAPSLTSTTWVLVTAAVVLPTIFIEKLGQVAWLSVVGMTAVLGVVATAICYGASRTTEQEIGYESSQLLFWDTENVAVAVGIAFFCYESHSILTDMEENMQDRNNFGAALFGGYAVLSIVNVVFGVTVVWAFGQDTQEIVVHNLPAGPISTAVTSLLVASVVFTFAPLVHAYVHNLEHSRLSEYLLRLVPRRAWFVGVRLIFLLLALFIAVQVHHFAYFAAFSGSLLTPLGTIVFPPAFHLRLKYKELKPWQITLDVVVLIVGLLMWVTMVFVSAKKVFAGL